MIDGATEELTRLFARVMTHGARQTAREEVNRDKQWVSDASTTPKKLLRAGQSGSELVGVILSITLAAVVGFVGIKVNSELEGSVTDKDLSSTDDVNQTVYENSSENISVGFSDAMGMVDIVFLVLVFSVIVGALLAFRNTR